MGTPAMGRAVQFGIGANATVSNQFEIFSCDITKRASQIQSPGMRGTRSHIAQGVTDGVYTAGGVVVMEPRPDDLAFLLPYILGAAANGTAFELAETLGSFYCTVDKVTKVYTYAGCKVNSAVFESGPNRNLRLSLDIQGTTETAANAATFPAISATLSALQPYVHHQAVLTIATVAYALKNIRLEINNALLLDDFNNSQTRQQLPESDRIVTLSCDMPFSSDEVALYGLALAGANGSLVYTNGTVALTFTFGNLKAPAEGPVVSDRTAEIPLRLTLQAYKTGATPELSVTNDSTV